MAPLVCKRPGNTCVYQPLLHHRMPSVYACLYASLYAYIQVCKYECMCLVYMCGEAIGVCECVYMCNMCISVHLMGTQGLLWISSCTHFSCTHFMHTLVAVSCTHLLHPLVAPTCCCIFLPCLKPSLSLFLSLSLSFSPCLSLFPLALSCVVKRQHQVHLFIETCSLSCLWCSL